MRSIGAGFGLVAFMIAIAITLWMWASYTKEVAHYGTAAQKEAQQFAGQDEYGRPAIRSISLTPEEQNGKLKYVLVDQIDPAGAFAKWFHLQQGDAIVAVAGFDFRDADSELALAMIQESYQRRQELTVLRGGKKILLPSGMVLEDNSSLAAQLNLAPPPTTQPLQPAPQANQTSEERVVPKELAPLKGIIR